MYLSLIQVGEEQTHAVFRKRNDPNLLRENQMTDKRLSCAVHMLILIAGAEPPEELTLLRVYRTIAETELQRLTLADCMQSMRAAMEGTK